jgi:hypothetical protein
VEKWSRRFLRHALLFLGARFASKARFMSDEIGRRAFVSRTIAVGAMWGMRNLCGASPTLRLGIVARPPADALPVILGARLGAEEASHAAALFGAGPVEVTVGSINEVLAHDVVAVLAAENSAEECLRLAEASVEHGALFLNATCTDDVLRGERCRAAAFHVAPSRAMLRDALNDARGRAEVPVPDGATVVAWDSSLERFGADTLNNRFRARFQTAMTADAWCGWFAVKALSEASLRTRSVDGRSIASYLRGPGAQFDGHKGRPLSFRAWDNQLRQPLYIIGNADGARRLIAESPGSAPASATSREILDGIGTTATSTTCHFAP